MEECPKTTPRDRGRQTGGCSSGQTSTQKGGLHPETTHICVICDKVCHYTLDFSAINHAATTQQEINKIKNKNKYIRMYHPSSSLTDGGLYDDWPTLLRSQTVRVGAHCVISSTCAKAKLNFGGSLIMAILSSSEFQSVRLSRGRLYISNRLCWVDGIECFAIEMSSAMQNWLKMSDGQD